MELNCTCAFVSFIYTTVAIESIIYSGNSKTLPITSCITPCDVTIELNCRIFIDIEEGQSTDQYTQYRCSCTIGPKKSACCQIFSKEYYHHYHSQCFEMTKKSRLDNSNGNSPNKHINFGPHFTKHRHPSEERQRSLMFFYHYGIRICLKTFRRFIALRAHYRQNGLVPRVNRSASCSLYWSFFIFQL